MDEINMTQSEIEDMESLPEFKAYVTVQARLNPADPDDWDRIDAYRHPKKYGCKNSTGVIRKGLDMVRGKTPANESELVKIIQELKTVILSSVHQGKVVSAQDVGDVLRQADRLGI